MESEQIRRVVRDTANTQEEGYFIIRAQRHREINMKFNNGKIENIYTAEENGMGVQGFTESGASGFASADEISLPMGASLVRKAFALASENQRIGCERNTEIFRFSQQVADLPNQAGMPWEEISLEEYRKKLEAIQQRLFRFQLDKASISWTTTYRQVEDFWCIGRSDGTLVSFFVPRAVLLHMGTLKADQHGQSFSVQRSGMDGGLLTLEEADGALEIQAQEKARFIQQVMTASFLPSGSYPLVIDQGLAKGLAHEAFGHAVESDLLQESILGEDGKLRQGLVVARRGVDIIDGSLENDWAYQPYSANGERRQTVTIVQDGVLKQGLGDVFSAKQSGMESTGAGRAEYYGIVPLPRMTNIRLSLKDHYPMKKSPILKEEVKRLRERLDQLGLLQKDHHYLLLGYRGGQVNIKTGDFVFQCEGAVNLADPALPIHQPGIFSGKILSVLASVQGSIGEEKLDAIGTCGKAGQSVPSSGGASGYVLLEKNEYIKVGGSDNGN